MTKFFEPISTSAVHIYHSALELSPLSSIVRRLYYHKWHTPFPTVLVGAPDSWDHSLAYSNVQSKCNSYTWSPCGQFIAVETEEGVEIHDPLTFELFSTLQHTKCTLKPTEAIFQFVVPSHPALEHTSTPAYSPDGHSIAFLSGTSLIIWDIQTGGMAKKITCNRSICDSLVWSLDGKTVCTISQGWDVHTYDITSGARLFFGQLHSSSRPHLWAHGTSLWTMTIEKVGQTQTINIFEVGSVLTKVESFPIALRTRKTWSKFFSREGDYQIKSFSPATYHISMYSFHELLILDIQNSECLLKQEDRFGSHCFSSEGGLFAASSEISIHIWKYTFPHYTPWREFPLQGLDSPYDFTLQFSPTLSSIMGQPSIMGHETLQVWHLDGPPIIAHSNSHQSLAVLSSCGTYVVIGYRGDSTITITNLLSQTTHFIETGMKIHIFALTGNVLLVEDSKTIAAWLLRGKGVVDSVFGNGKAGHYCKIWTIPQSLALGFVVEDQIVIIQDRVKQKCIHTYHTGTGEVLKPTQVSPYDPHHQHSLYAIYRGRHYPCYHGLNKENTCPEDNWPVSQTMFQEGWMKNPEGKHCLWIPARWRKPVVEGGWFYNITTLNLEGNIIIKF